MKKLCIILIATLLSTSIFAANVSWLGGTGNWNTAAKWSTGAVPTVSDDVTIPSGTVNINSGVAAFAKSVDNQNGILNVKAGGSLTVTGSGKSFAVKNSNVLTVRGFLSIEDNGSAANTGLYNLDTLDIKQAAVVSIEGFNYGIDNREYFINLGLIDISTASVYGFEQSSGGTFTNGTTGTINISNSPMGLYQSASCIFSNEGSLDIDTGDYGIYSLGSDITNTTSGTINISGVEVYGISFRDNGTFINRGDLTVVDSHSGISVSNSSNQAPGPAFENTEAGNIEITTEITGVNVNDNFCAFTNSGIMELTSGSYCVYNTSPSFINNVCAEMYINGSVYNSSMGVIQNNAKWVMNNTLGSINYGSIENLGILEDNNAVLSPYITNSRLVVRPISGPLTVGVPVNNVLDAVSWGTFQAVGIFIDEAATTYAGTFGQANNRFTPNASAIGLSNVYIKIRRGANQCPEVMRIAVLTPFAPVRVADRAQDEQPNQPLVDQAFSVFPNPSNGKFSLRGVASNGPAEVLLIDVLGKPVFEQTIDFQKAETLEFQESIIKGTGVYFLKIMQNGKIVWQQRVVVTD